MNTTYTNLKTGKDYTVISSNAEGVILQKEGNKKPGKPIAWEAFIAQYEFISGEQIAQPVEQTTKTATPTREEKALNAYSVLEDFLNALANTNCEVVYKRDHDKLNRVVTVYAKGTKSLLLYASFANKGIRTQVRYKEQVEEFKLPIKELAAARSGNYSVILDYTPEVYDQLDSIILKGIDLYAAEKINKKGQPAE